MNKTKDVETWEVRGAWIEATSNTGKRLDVTGLNELLQAQSTALQNAREALEEMPDLVASLVSSAMIAEPDEISSELLHGLMECRGRAEQALRALRSGSDDQPEQRATQ